MKPFLLILPLLTLGLSACQTTTPGQNAAIGGLGGAAVGAAIADDNELQGALIGAAVGVAGSQLIGNSQQPGQCYYRNSRGQRYIDRC